MNVHFPTIPQAQMTQEFGRYNPALYGRERPHHMGEDYGPAPGNPVYAAMDGVVTQANSTGKVGYGGQVRIQNAEGAVILVGHLTRWDVVAGQTVQAGQVIGLSGGDPKDPNSGSSTGAHIHFEVRPPGKTTNDHSAINPTKYLLEFVPAELRKITIKERRGMNVRFGPGANHIKLNDGLTFGAVDYIVELDPAGWGRLDRLRPEWVYCGNPAWVTVDDEIIVRPGRTLGAPEVPPALPPEPLDIESRVADLERRVEMLEKVAGYGKNIT